MMKQLKVKLHEGLGNKGMSSFDPCDPQADQHVCELADRLVSEATSTEQLEQLEQASTEESLAGQLAIKLAKSKSALQSVRQPLHVSLVFAVYKEHTRILLPGEHPHGEDFVARKIQQLNWLFEHSASRTWDLCIVDDGCPEGSGHIARKLIEERFPGEPIQVLFLEEAIRNRLPIAGNLQSTGESQKGGAIIYGMWAAAQENRPGHIVGFTDADLSTHLGQTGLLINGIVHGKKDAATGSRREANSVVIKQGGRNTRGKMFIYLWKSLIQPLHYITDTQCGFKAFTVETVNEICGDLIERRFAFDIELLMKTELRRAHSITKVPIAWIDSEEASTTTGLQPYLPMLKSVVKMYRKYLPTDPNAERFARFIESMTENQWQNLSTQVPTEIADADPSEFSSFRPITVDQLEAITAEPEDTGK